MNWISKKANQIYKKYGLDDLDFIAEKLGARIFEELQTELLKEVYFPRLKAIALKPNLDPYEKRYLIAHALGHHLFHRNLNLSYIRLHEEGLAGSLELGRSEIGRKEREADMFAVYLLIPEEKLKPILNQDWIKETYDPIPYLAEEFQVPEELVRKRLEFEEILRNNFFQRNGYEKI